MGNEPLPLLKRLKVGVYENSVILTYNADLLFYEQVVLPTLRSRGCYNNLVLMDLEQYEAALTSAVALSPIKKTVMQKVYRLSSQI